MKHIICLLAALTLCSPAWASSDHDRARRALEAGQILPLKDILARAETEFPGHLVEAELEDEDGALVYELKILTTGGRVMKLYYDARTGELLKAKGRENRR